MGMYTIWRGTLRDMYGIPYFPKYKIFMYPPYRENYSYISKPKRKRSSRHPTRKSHSYSSRRRRYRSSYLSRIYHPISLSKKRHSYQSNKAAETKISDLTHYKKEAYKLFVNKKYDEAKAILENNNVWLIDFICGYFSKLNSGSFSSVGMNPYQYMVNNILKIREYSPALELGKEVHAAAENFIEGKDHRVEEQFVPYVENVEKLVGEIKSEYSEVEQVEKFFEIPFSTIADIPSDLKFRGKIDAVFKNAGSPKKYLIVDWKTDKDMERSSIHRRQLEVYKRVFCRINGISPDSVKVTIAYVGLRAKINIDQKIDTKIDEKQPQASAFRTFTKHVEKVINWKNNPRLFLKDLSEYKVNASNNERLWRSIVEQYLYESQLSV